MAKKGQPKGQPVVLPYCYEDLKELMAKQGKRKDKVKADRKHRDTVETVVNTIKGRLQYTYLKDFCQYFYYQRNTFTNKIQLVAAGRDCEPFMTHPTAREGLAKFIACLLSDDDAVRAAAFLVARDLEFLTDRMYVALRQERPDGAAVGTADSK